MILLGGTVSSNLWHHKKLSTSIIAEISWEQFTLQNESISWTKVLAIAWSQTLDRKTNWARTWQYLDILSRCAGIWKIIPLDCSFESGQQVNWNICSDIIQMKLSICWWRTFVELLWRETVFKKCVAKMLLNGNTGGNYQNPLWISEHCVEQKFDCEENCPSWRIAKIFFRNIWCILKYGKDAFQCTVCVHMVNYLWIEGRK